MKSHTVPKKLLEQFAYSDPHTQSLRLWRYEKNRPPYPNASPKSATRIDGHFAHPDDAAKEEELESRLAQTIEAPVNQFLSDVGIPGFVMSDERKRIMTVYVSLLFHRSEARRSATRHTQEVVAHALNRFMQNESQVLTVAAKWSIDGLLSGRIDWLVTPRNVIGAARSVFEVSQTEQRRQTTYAETIERVIASFDGLVCDGEWNLLSAPSNEPFVISDAPVVTWAREPQGINYGVGFHRPDVEVFLPLSPLVCLHILPKVERTQIVRQPTTQEVNAAQAAFAGRYCFSNVRSSMIDAIFQQNFGKARLGVTAFTVWHRDYDQSFYNMFMNGGSWVDPPRR
jgi:hypothetical protein